MANILWIDDKAGGGTKNRLGFDGLIYFIEKNGHHIEIVSIGEQIENAIKPNKEYDLIILDIIMDSLSSATEHTHQFGGFDALEILMDSKPKTPIIILSVMSLQMIRDEANRRNIDLTQSGIREILRKGPILPMDLANTVEKILAENINIEAGDHT
ncbi:MAG: response regulator [Chloroflexi bacterium]|nr:response regulator [Chloroflexota bacterium]